MQLRCASSAGIAGAMVLLAAANAAHADELELIAARDNAMFQSVDGSLSSGEGYLFAGRTGPNGPGVMRSLVAFDLSAIPQGAVITNVQLRLMLARARSGVTAVTVHRVLQNWGEGTSNAAAGLGSPATVSDATWLHTFYPDSLWNTPGGDFSATASATAQVGTSVGTYVDWSGPGLLADVLAWRANPSQNFGWMIRGQETGDRTAREFGSRENPNQFWRPRLIVTYVIPSPGAAAVLGAGGLVALRRRRR